MYSDHMYALHIGRLYIDAVEVRFSRIDVLNLYDGRHWVCCSCALQGLVSAIAGGNERSV